MDLESKIDKYKHYFKSASPPYTPVGDEPVDYKKLGRNEEEFYKFKDE